MKMFSFPYRTQQDDIYVNENINTQNLLRKNRLSEQKISQIIAQHSTIDGCLKSCFRNVDFISPFQTRLRFAYDHELKTEGGTCCIRYCNARIVVHY
ncbi:CLUMA_CG014738, isoform A [Clunio marinus]|uniref:CLUMA_CG014738, isoform A n=1 Tax=Clunio marinus TaxID=568069 RepID=A0A1J1ILR8_9DIPT|nr:CLUMA_CG014738, isoform A [Clunio marinus]